MKLLKIFAISIFSALVFGFFTSIALAIPSVDFTYIESDLGGGIWQYEYTASNASDPIADAGCDLYDLYFTFDTAATFSIIQLPTGWDEIDGAGFMTAYSMNMGVPPVGTDIAPGSALSGFIFQFDYQAGDLYFEANLVNQSDIYIGTSTAASSPVPEPATILLLCFGLIGLVSIRR